MTLNLLNQTEQLNSTYEIDLAVFVTDDVVSESEDSETTELFDEQTDYSQFVPVYNYSQSNYEESSYVHDECP